MPKPIHLLNGPNLNLLGFREPHIYGSTTLEQVRERCLHKARAAGYDLVFRQTNHEGVLVDWVQEAREEASAILINAGAYSHTSLALHDALKTVDIPIVECHVSNPHAREAFRHVSYVSLVATGVVVGFGPLSYEIALDAVMSLLAAQATPKVVQAKVP